MLKLLRLPIQFFSADPNGGGGIEPPADSAGNPGGNEPPATPTPPAEPPAEPGKTFTQEDMNNLVARESKAAQEKLLKQLGIEDFDGAKEGLEKFREWQESQKTEAERQAEALKEFEEKTGSLSSENATLKAQLSALKAGVKAESADDVVALAERLVNDETDINAAITSVIEKYPHFAQVTEPTDPNAPPKPQFSNGQHQAPPPPTMDEKFLQAVKDKFGRK